MRLRIGRKPRIYYNDNDPRIVAWLKELIVDQLIPYGDVDARPIEEVSGSDVADYHQCHFFAGIGGWPVALEIAGFKGPCWTGSCPCQPFSGAGKRRGDKDSRHLWPEFRRLIAECGPPVIFGEQVASNDGRKWLSRVRFEMEELGYGVGCADLCASSIAAPHIRQRLFWMAESESQYDRAGEFRQGRRSESSDRRNGNGLEVAQPVGRRRRDDGRDLCSGEQVGPEVSTSGPGSSYVGLALPVRGRTGRHSGTDEGSECETESQRTSNRHERESRDSRSDGRLAHHHHQGPQGRDCGIVCECGGQCASGKSSSQSRVDNAESGETYSAEPGQLVPAEGGWTDSYWHYCSDGKYRRVPIEPALFPLADGFPERVGLLRGAGNAIVPQLTAVFIKAATGCD